MVLGGIRNGKMGPSRRVAGKPQGGVVKKGCPKAPPSLGCTGKKERNNVQGTSLVEGPLRIFPRKGHQG